MKVIPAPCQLAVMSGAGAFGNVWNVNEDLRSAAALTQLCADSRALIPRNLRAGIGAKERALPLSMSNNQFRFALRREMLLDEEGAKKRLKIIGTLHFLRALESEGPATEVRY